MVTIIVSFQVLTGAQKRNGNDNQMNKQPKTTIKALNVIKPLSSTVHSSINLFFILYADQVYTEQFNPNKAPDRKCMCTVKQAGF